MISLTELINRYMTARQTNNPNELTCFFKSIEDVPLPTALAINKARAIQLSDGNEYSLGDAERLLRTIIEIDPAAVPAYIELGCLLDAVLDQSKEAIDVFDRGIEQAQKQLHELNFEKAKAQMGRKEYSDALQTLEQYRSDEGRFQQLREEVEERLRSE
ncbi:hypothetical protein SKTS_26060 [Sulfurimicrobium lacus]|uniref:Tetratricopeptide repeat protein n=1 Tax=Sulfurimicrobium lacus TaxID=2715678 RepID=A0A6F8VEF1_9PROT|nr:hypothetical protein [Sulfurimicrobium lacus]BCB27720.1 hypothetical protein SKTS_26060 [Sulfurimicrobium lacus]